MQPLGQPAQLLEGPRELILRAGDLFLVPPPWPTVGCRAGSPPALPVAAPPDRARGAPAAGVPHLASRGSAGATPRAPRRGPAPRPGAGRSMPPAGLRADRLQQPRVLQHGRVVDQDGHRLALALHHGHRAPRAGIGKRQHPALGVDEHPGPTASSRSPALGRRAPGTARRGACPTVPRRARRRGRQRPLAATGDQQTRQQPSGKHTQRLVHEQRRTTGIAWGRTRRAAAVPESTRLRPAVAWRAMRRASGPTARTYSRAETAAAAGRRRSARSG